MLRQETAMQADLIQKLENSPAWGEVLELRRQKRSLALYDMASSQRLFSALALAQDGPVLYILPHERAARQVAEDLAQLGEPGIVYLPQKELRFLHAVSSRSGDWQRLRALEMARSGEAKLLICSIEGLQTRFAPPSWFDEARISIRPGDQFQPPDLALRLVQMGYERVELVEGKSQFALRGDILDIYPPSMDTPVRIEFFDVSVDTVRAFDQLTQRSTEQLTGMTIMPAAEMIIPLPLREEACSRIEATLQQHAGSNLPFHQADSPITPAPDLDRLKETGLFEDMHMWAHYLCPEDTSLLDWLPDALILVDTPDRGMQRLEENILGYTGMLASAIETGAGHPAQEGLLRRREEVLSLLSLRTVITLQEMLRGMGGLTPEVSIKLTGRRPESYRGRLPDLARDLRGWEELGYTVALFTGGQARSERLAAMLAGQDLSLSLDGSAFGNEHWLRVRTENLAEGFIFEDAKLVLLAPVELFGSSKQKVHKARTGEQRIEAFTDLSVGDLVVHEHHGVGVYEGTVRLQSEGIWRDYLFIRYRGSDKLYVPTDQFDRVQKYIGNPDNQPELNDLSSNNWSRQKSKVKAGLKQLAFDLVKLYAARQATPGFPFEPAEPFESQFADGFAYELTSDQEQAVQEVLSDAEKPQNMDRLLCGDVGYGKTEVAVRAAFRAVMNSKQVAFLAPTTILVMQHMRTLLKRFEGFPVNIEFVSRFQSPRENKQILQKARDGKVDILIGTHRLLSKDVAFKNLGLLIIDEEQRFGVRHKEQIKNYKTSIDVLTLSATPIPRTLHMSMVGVRDMSLLEIPPEERFPVATYVVEYQDTLIRDAILREISRGGQAFFLYNHVADIETMASRLRQLVPEARIAVAHGQMPEQALEDVMIDFYAAKFDVLLCSTIIENGLDIQNANTLIVYDADRFGLSQLYQIRGRVGRGNREAYAFFTVRQDKAISETAEKRLAAIKEFTAFGAGFRIAMRDLEIRGAGNIFGPEQSGQIAAVGYDMYVKMIGEAIKEAQGDFSSLRDSELETRVDMYVNAFLPEQYVRGETQRIEIYKLIAMIRTEADREELIADLVDRFGEPEEPVLNLIQIARLRALANALGAERVSHDEGRMVLRFHPRFAADPQRLYQALLQGDKRLSLNAGKHTSLIIKLPGMEAQDAMNAAVAVLTKLLEALENQRCLTP
jgi:transcription-repair coupling factor (superfamily II helicase)